MTGDFAQEEVFGETWVLQDNRGALAYFGASTLTNWPHDDVLERGYIDFFFSGIQPPVDLGTMLDAGLTAVELAFSGQAQYVWEAYNLLGDPAVKLFLQPDLPTFTLQVEPASLNVCTSGQVSSTITIGSALEYAETVSLETGATPTNVNASFDPSSSVAPFTSEFTLDIAEGTLAGDYTINIAAFDNAGLTHSASVDLRVVTETPLQPILVTPLDASFDQALRPLFGWATPTLTDLQTFQLADTAGFENILIDATNLLTTNYQPLIPLEQGRCYWWRANAGNACGVGDWSIPFHFATATLDNAFWDDIESGEVNWSHQAAIGADAWEITTDLSHSPTQAWHVPNANRNHRHPAVEHGAGLDPTRQHPQLLAPVPHRVRLRWWCDRDLDRRRRHLERPGTVHHRQWLYRGAQLRL